ncbi:hypothetical protein JXA02_10770 [candidate division KSB1 bacterium]|nr:hypothetical protein [candidate division KSB1 bacterium]
MNELFHIVDEGGKRMSELITSVIGIILRFVLLFFVIGIILGYILFRYLFA